MATIRQYFSERQNSTENDDLRKKLRRHKIIKNMVILLIVLVMIMIGYQLFITFYNKVYTQVKIEKSIENKMGGGTEFLKFGNQMLAYNHDGVSCLDAEGNSIWEQSFEMEDILFDICEDYVAFAERNGTEIYVISADGTKNTLKVTMPVRQIRVTDKGMTAVLLQDDKSYYMKYMDKDGMMLAESQIRMNDTGYPLDMDLSNDGKKMAFSYLYISQGVIKTVLTFYNFDTVGEEKINHIVSTESYEGEMFPRFVFLNNDVAVAFGSEHILVYKGTQKPLLVETIDISKEIKSIFYDESSFGIVQRGNKDSKNLFTLYNLKGQKLFEKGFSTNDTNIVLEDDRIIIYGENDLLIWEKDGDKKYEGTYPSEIQTILSTKYIQKYTIFTEKTIDIVSLK